jgi:hypothetical protein
MTYVTDSVTESTNYQMYILIAVALILALVVIAIFVLKSKMNQQLNEMKKISELLEKNGLNTGNAADRNSNVPVGAVADNYDNAEIVTQDNEKEISEPAEEITVTDKQEPVHQEVQETIEGSEQTAETEQAEVQQDFTWPETAEATKEEKPEELQEAIKEEAPSIIQTSNEGEFVFNGTEENSQNTEINEPSMDSFEGTFEESFENVSFDEPIQEKENIIIDSVPQADVPQPEQSFVSEKPLFGEFTEPAERVHIEPEQPAPVQPAPVEPQPAPVQQPQQPGTKQRMTFDTARSGRAYDKSEIESIIKS